MVRLKTLLKLTRPAEWVKNGFVLAPLIFSGSLRNGEAVRNAFLAMAALCFISSSIYIMNDLLDIEYDKQHPVKRFRPLASGLVSPSSAAVLMLLLIVAGFCVLVFSQISPLGWWFVAAYLLLNAAYSLYLKKKVIIDVLTISFGFVLRVLIGSEAISVKVTHWLILCTFLLATFLGFSKRRHELTVLGPGGRRHRPVLTFYTTEFLDRMSMLTLAMTLTCYILYTIAPETISRFKTDTLVYSSLIVVFALFRFLFLIHIKKMGSPTEIIYYDRQILLAILVWIIYVMFVIYTWPSVRPHLP